MAQRIIAYRNVSVGYDSSFPGKLGDAGTCNFIDTFCRSCSMGISTYIHKFCE